MRTITRFGIVIYALCFSASILASPEGAFPQSDRHSVTEHSDGHAAEHTNHATSLDGLDPDRIRVDIDLKTEDFEEKTAQGLWFVKHFSPYCSHCIAMAPIWEEVAINKTSKYGSTVHFGDVDCVANGDVCQKNGVKMFPHVAAYLDGQKLDDYQNTAERVFESLSEFVENFALTEPSKSSKPKAQPVLSKPANLEGVSIALDTASFHDKVRGAAENERGWFIKFYAPWCSHCKAIAPVWENLATQMKDKLNIGEIDCQENNALCKELGIKGYPTMTFFKGMSDIEYESARSLIEMTSFAEKVADASVRDVDQSDYEQLKRTEEVLFMYFYDSKMAEEDFAPLDATLLPLISHASLLKTNDKALLKKYGITSCPSLLVIRNDRVSVYPATSPHAFKYSDQILQWMKTVWLPIVPEITASNAREVTAGKLVALAVLDPADAAFETYKSQLLTSATQWMDKEGDSIVAQSLPGTATKIRPVAFAWIDGMAWAKWLASAYNIDIQTTGPRYVINDQETKQYWDQKIDLAPITDVEDLHSTLQTIISSPTRIPSKSLRGVFGKTLIAIQDVIQNKAVLLFAVVGAGLALFYTWLRRRRNTWLRNGGSNSLAATTSGGFTSNKSASPEHIHIGTGTGMGGQGKYD